VSFPEGQMGISIEQVAVNFRAAPPHLCYTSSLIRMLPFLSLRMAPKRNCLLS
jgi:hypothetical protein